MKRQRLLFIFFSAALLFCCSAALVSAFTLPDTGQTKCYDTAGTEISCTGTGQDGAYNINPMSYTDNGNGTITDNVTGLMWQKGENASYYNWYKASGTYEATYNPSSQSVCGSLTLGGQSGWRLPTKKELITIVDYSIHDPDLTINTTYFPNASAGFYWSSTTIAYYTNNAWLVNFYDGSVYSHGTSYGGYVRCVHGEQSSPSFTNNGNGTITDNGTGLMWQQGEQGAMTWANALSYCEGVSLGGFSDWRLPNVKELESITDDTKYNPAIDTSYFPNVNAHFYWSSTTYASHYSNGAWYVAFGSGGSVYNYDKSGYGGGYVRCVRGGQSGSLCNLAISPSSQTFTSAAGTGSVTVTVTATGSNCTWTASSSLSWVTITSGSSGTGSGSVTISVAANTTGAARTGNITIAGQTFIVTQAAAPSCTFSILPTNQTFTSSGGTDSVTVTGSGAWTATSSLSWVTITSSASGSGNGTVTFSVAANTTGATRTGNITIAGQTFMITQTSGSQSVSLVVTTPASQTYFDTIQADYNANTATSGSTILAQGVTLTENLVFNQNNSITLTGGYNSSFSSVGGTMTTVLGSLTISGGTVTVANLVIQ